MSIVFVSKLFCNTVDQPITIVNCTIYYHIPSKDHQPALALNSKELFM